MTTPLPDLPATALKAMLETGAFTAVELTQTYLDRIEADKGRINAIPTLNPGALEEAAAADRLRRAGGAVPPLCGLPVAVKDIFATRGLRTTIGNPLFAGNVPDRDDGLVARERAAGAVILGKSNTPDCASGGITANAVLGLTRNPWNPARTTSGSGGGGAAAIAAGHAALADGSDVGGSARTPAGWTNTVGLRPSSGRIPQAPGGLADGGQSTAGVIARTVADATLFLAAVAGPDPRWPQSRDFAQPIRVEGLAPPVRGLRALWAPGLPGQAVDKGIVALLQTALAALKDAGIALCEGDLPVGAGYTALWVDMNAKGYAHYLPDRVMAAWRRGDPVKPSIAGNLERYFALSAARLLEMEREVGQMAVRFADLFATHAVFITPTHAAPAFGIDDTAAEAAHDYANLYIAPLMGLPSVSVPMGFLPDGMPEGLMITGRPGADMDVLRVALALETALPFWQRRPPG